MTVTQFKAETRSQARDKADEYAEAVRSGKAHPGDEDLMLAYRAMARGKVVIDLVTAMADAGLDAAGRPRLAVCRADAKTCTFREWNGYRYFCANGDWPRKGDNKNTIRLSPQTWAGAPVWVTKEDARAAVPTVPPAKRPDRPLEEFFILWEAEWLPKLPVDPFLLKRIRGPLFAVVAHWDLTPLEQAVLRGRVMP